jgi:hypothetical protein
MSSRCVLAMLLGIVLLAPKASLGAATLGLQFHSVDDCRVFDSLNYAPPTPVAAHTAVGIFLSDKAGTVSVQGGDLSAAPRCRTTPRPTR